MLDLFFGRGFNASKCKALLKLTIPRIKLLRNRRENEIKHMRRDIAKLLETGQEASARIRVEHVIREEKMMAAQEIVELFCELVFVRLPIVEAQRECPLDLKEAISSLCFAAPRCADLTELQQVKMLFAGKYGKEFVASATELKPECGVNRQLVELLSVRAPPPDVKLILLEEIAKEHDVDWEPSVSEKELSKTREDLLNGSVQFSGGLKVPLPEVQRDEAKSTTSESASSVHPHSDEDYEIIDSSEVPIEPLQSNKYSNSVPEMLPFPIDALSEANELALPILSHLEPGVFLGLNPMMKKAVKNSQSSITKTVHDSDFRDVLAAAQAAAETAERSSAAARLAAGLAQLRINELMKKKSEESSSENPFHLEKTKEEEAELDADNPFAYSNTPFTSPPRNNTSENYTTNHAMTHHSYDNDDANNGFDSYHESDNYGDLHRPQRLPSMDDDTYFSYPNLFTSQDSK